MWKSCLKRAPGLTVATLSLCASALAPFGQTATAGADAELVALDDAWIHAEVHRDRAALERILDDQYLATFASGNTVDQTAYIDWIMQATIEPFEVVHDVIRVHGDVALVIDTSTDGETKFTWIAVKREGQWRVISLTFTHVAKP